MTTPHINSEIPNNYTINNNSVTGAKKKKKSRNLNRQLTIGINPSHNSNFYHRPKFSQLSTTGEEIKITKLPPICGISWRSLIQEAIRGRTVQIRYKRIIIIIPIMDSYDTNRKKRYQENNPMHFDLFMRWPGVK